MSIPQRLARIARHKFNEVKERIEQLDEEAAQRELEAEQQRLHRTDARRELNDATSAPRASDSAVQPSSAGATTPRLRSPQEIAGGSRSGTQPATSTAVSATQIAQNDPLLFHYRLLGVEPGSDFAAVQAAYNRLAARCDPARFPAGSQEEQEAKQIRERLETSYRALRDALDPTARRFGLLDFGNPKPPASNP
jgi:hypothetical protein